MKALPLSISVLSSEEVLSLSSVPLLQTLHLLHRPHHDQTVLPVEQRLKEEALVSKQTLQTEVLEDVISLSDLFQRNL